MRIFAIAKSFLLLHSMNTSLLHDNYNTRVYILCCFPAAHVDRAICKVPENFFGGSMYVQISSRVITPPPEWVLSCDSSHRCWLNVEQQFRDRAGFWFRLLPQTHYSTCQKEPFLHMWQTEQAYSQKNSLASPNPKSKTSLLNNNLLQLWEHMHTIIFLSKLYTLFYCDALLTGYFSCKLHFLFAQVSRREPD